jgi:hypothetical protein
MGNNKLNFFRRESFAIGCGKNACRYGACPAYSGRRCFNWLKCQILCYL